MIIDTEKIEKLMFDDGYSIYEIAKSCGISSRPSLNNARNKENIEKLTLETVKKLQEFINQEETENEHWK